MTTGWILIHRRCSLTITGHDNPNEVAAGAVEYSRGGRFSETARANRS